MTFPVIPSEEGNPRLLLDNTARRRFCQLRSAGHSYENKSQVGKIALAISAFRTEVPDLCRSPIRSEGRQASLHSIIRLAGVPPR